MDARAYKSCVAALVLGCALVRPLVAGMARSGNSEEKHASVREPKLWREFESQSKFIEVPGSSESGRCESTTPPEPLTTPAPLVDAPTVGKELSVSFIIGEDGLVHSALLLTSIGNNGDRAVLNVVRSWRYRPARCNGVPAETEATVEFSSHEKGFGLK